MKAKLTMSSGREYIIDVTNDIRYLLQESIAGRSSLMNVTEMLLGIPGGADMIASVDFLE